MSSRDRACRAPLSFVAIALALACGEEDFSREPFQGAGGGAADMGSVPVLRGAVMLSDDEVAREALAALGSTAVGAEGSCRNCHSLGRPTLSRWSALTNAFSDECLADTALASDSAAGDMLACFQRHARSPDTLRAADFGVYSTAAHLPWFSYVFEHSSTDGSDGRARHEAFVARAGMPRAGELFSQEQFDVVAEWFERDLPNLFELVPEDNGEDCTPRLDPALRAHVDQMQLSGWRARNEQAPLLMFGCDGGQRGAECLSGSPLARDTAIGAGWDPPGEAQIRILHDNSSTPSRFWSRTSPDGRYIASGLIDDGANLTGQFVDLEQSRVIGANFSYDPTFFPDNSGFLVQRDGGFSSAAPGDGPTNGGADRGDVAVICEQSVLTGDPDTISGDEAQCVTLEGQIGLYQQLAKSTDGEDYWVVYGSYDSDNGGREVVLDNPSAAFASDSITSMTPVINRGSSFEPSEPVRVETPLQGDPMLSPSGRLLVTRIKGREIITQTDGVDIVSAQQSGYALHLVTTSQVDGRWTASLTDVGRICKAGSKAVVSYDERWMVFHHYVTADDAAELGLSEDEQALARYLELGASNLYLADLTNGALHSITRMAPGQYALFPHFRSDGWIYFVVRTLDGEEYFAASNAALLLESGGGG